MSKTDLKQLLKILANNFFSFTIFDDGFLSVTYDTGKTTGKFRLDLNAFEPEQRSKIFEALNGPKKINGTIPVDVLTKDLAEKLNCPPKVKPEPQPEPVKTTEPLTKQNVGKEFDRITRLIKGNEEEIIFESWGPSETITRKWDGKNLITVQFDVEGFLFTGKVSVTKLHDRGTFTVSLLKGKKPGKVVKVVEKVQGEDLNGLIDTLVENDEENAYQQRIITLYKLNEEKKAA